MQKFSPGEVVITQAALEILNLDDIQTCLTRHLRGDWGDLCDVDKTINDMALENNSDRLLSAYTDRFGTKFWIITEWDRSVTTVLLPEDY